MSNKVNKREIARNIRNAVLNEDLGDQSARQVYIESCVNQGLSKNCASTYWQMMKVEDQGGDPYRHHKHRKEGTSVKVNNKETAVTGWVVQTKETGEVVKTASSRDDARAILKQMGGAKAGFTVAKL